MLPDGIPTVTVTGRYLSLNDDGQPLTGQVIFRAPSLITFPDYDVILGAPVTAPLDASGAFRVELPATDAPGMNPTGWSYQVAEQLAGVPMNRVYSVLLPSDVPAVDIADIAPTDPTTPTYVAVRGDSAYEVAVEAGFVGTEAEWLASLVGPQGAQGDTGAAGSQIFTGTTAPTADQGRDGDLYVQRESTTFLGVTSQTVTMWQKSAGVWGAQVPDLRGAAWYVNTSSTSSSETKPGDLLLRSDTGDLWQRSASGWGTPIGNLKGPQGPQGVKGDQGTPGVVQSVNSKSAADIVLNAADVGALAKTGSTDGVAATLTGTGSADPLTVNGGPSTSDRFVVRKDGSIYSNSLLNTLYNVGIGPGSTPFGGGRYVLGMQNASTEPTGTPGSGLVAYAKNGRLYVLQGDGTVVPVVDSVPLSQKGAASGVATLDSTSRLPIAQVPAAVAKNVWTPQSLGFQAWSVDPATVANPQTPKAAVPQRVYMCGVNITEPTIVNNVVIFARGWAGSTAVPAARFYGGIYDETGALVASSGEISNLPAAGQIANSGPGARNNHIGAVPLPLTSSITLQPGRYWLAFLMSAGASTDFYYFHIENWADSNPSNFFLAPAFQRAWYMVNKTSLPTPVNQDAGLADHDPAIMALANL